ncbi:MAG: YicC/YloC family endoribonuclease [Acidaminococcaceae bacterium]
MLKSMTGFGRGEFEDQQFSFVIEMKTVNHRYNEVAIRLPRFLNALEDKIRKTILKTVSRGRVDVFITATYTHSENCQVKVDAALAKSYHQALQDIGEAVGLTGTTLQPQAELLYLARCPEVISTKDGYFNVEELWPKMLTAIEDALANLVLMRTTEGNNIAADLKERATFIADKLQLIEERSPQVVLDYQARLTDRVNELLQACTEQKLEPERLIQEVAIFADRVNITEEIVRLQSHIKQFHTMLSSEQPVGRKMDFLIQEFNREANTIASKSNDFTITQITVEIKGEIEKIREQIQNIE